MSEYDNSLGTKRKRKAPDRLEVSFDSDKTYGSSSITILADGRVARENTKDESCTASSSGSLSKLLDIDGLKKGYKFEKNVLPDGDRDINMDKVFYYEHETPFSAFIEESAESWTEEDATETNLYVIKNFSSSTIQVGLYGPVSETKNEYYMMPQSPTDLMEKWNLDLLVDTFLLGGKLPIKVEFVLLSGGKRKKTYTGFVFSLERNEDGHIVCYSDRNRICIQRVLPLNMKIVEILDADRETIILMEKELRKLGVLV